MKHKRSGPRRPEQSESLNLHLGDVGREHLERARHLLGESDPTSERPSRGLVVRIAVKRLLLTLLADLAKRSVDPTHIHDEWSRVVEEEPTNGQSV